MSNHRSSKFAPALVALLFFVAFLIIEPLVLSERDAGRFGHYGMAVFWSMMATIVLWASLERAGAIPPQMRLGMWSREEWNPRRVYITLSSGIAVFALFSALLFLQGSWVFVLPFSVTMGLAVPLLFYWLYRLGIVKLVAGILLTLLGAIYLVSTVIILTRPPVFGDTLKASPVLTILLGFIVFLLSFLCLIGGVGLIRRWRQFTPWQASWRGFGWGYVNVLGMNIVMVAVGNPAMRFVGLPLGVYIFLYGLGKLLFNLKSRSSPERIEALGRSVGFGNFLRFVFIDRSQWENTYDQPQISGVTLVSLTRSLFDLLSLGAAIVALIIFREATVTQQLSFAILLILFHVASNLNDYYTFTQEIGTRERARLQQELRTAHDMQMGLMPKEDPVVPGFEISGICVPANEVGGDFFDYVWLDGEKTKLGIAVADVSGKAMKAAITAVMTSGMIYREVGSNESPKSIMRKINKPMYAKLDSRTFTALSFAMLDIKKKELRFSNAGQAYPVLKRGKEVTALEVKGARLPLGVKEEVPYDEMTVKLRKGDTVIFYTDGIPEAKNEKDEFYGFDRFKTLASTVEGTAKEVRDRILDDVKSFTGKSPQYDDMTVVVLRAV